MGEKNWLETEIIELFTDASPAVDSLVEGIGDDCAVIRPRPGYDIIATTDMLVDGVHFNSASHPPHSLGRKAMAVNISDIAAMGGTPEFAFLSLAIPANTTREWLTDFRDGIRSMLSEFTISLAGGDTVRGDQLNINVTLLGSTLSDRAVLRKGAKKGDSVYVSGQLGSAAAGLRLSGKLNLLSGLDQDLCKPFLQQHFDPHPDIICGTLLAGSGHVTAMQDISDGIATDLAHLCSQSGVGAEIESSKLPSHPDLQKVCGILNCDPLLLMIGGGEDYHLVFTVQAGKEEDVEHYMSERTEQRIYRIGKIIAGSGVVLREGRQTKNITYQGYQHDGSELTNE